MFKFGASEYSLGVAVLRCEVCGRQIVRTPCRVIIEGAKMTTCAQCAKLGSTHWEPASKSHSFPTKKGFRTTVKNVPIRKKNSVRVPEDVVVAEGFGSIVREARERLGLSHEDLGKKIREKVSVIKKIESGRVPPEDRLAKKLEYALGVRLLVPLVEPKIPFPSSPPKKGVTLGEVVRLKNERRRLPENEGNHS
jgi:putative transcription factor